MPIENHGDGVWNEEQTLALFIPSEPRERETGEWVCGDLLCNMLQAGHRPNPSGHDRIGVLAENGAGEGEHAQQDEVHPSAAGAAICARLCGSIEDPPGVQPPA